MVPRIDAHPSEHKKNGQTVNLILIERPPKRIITIKNFSLSTQNYLCTFVFVSYFVFKGITKVLI